MNAAYGYTSPGAAAAMHLQRYMAYFGATEDALRSVAVRAIARRTGARGLRSIMEAILLTTMFDLPGLDGVEEVVINREVAESRANPLYLYGKERAESSA